MLTGYEATAAPGVHVDAIRRHVMDGRLAVIDLGQRHRYIDPKYLGIVAGTLRKLAGTCREAMPTEVAENIWARLV